MDWSEQVVAELARRKSWAYHGDAPHACEPAALAALALLGHGRHEDALRPLDWLLRVQGNEGSIGVTDSQDSPRWTTTQAVLAWQLAAEQGEAKYAPAVAKAIGWIVQDAGTVVARTPEIAHDSTIVGWPWVSGTHSWMEPSCWAVLALRAAGGVNRAQTEDGQPLVELRLHEGLRLILDRLLPDGGCNYGNTFILGQALRPHLEPTGLAMVAVAGEDFFDPRLARSLIWLEREAPTCPATISLCYAIMGLAAHECRPTNADALLATAARRTLANDPSAHKLALLALAALGPRNPLNPKPAANSKPAENDAP